MSLTTKKPRSPDTTLAQFSPILTAIDNLVDELSRMSTEGESCEEILLIEQALIKKLQQYEQTFTRYIFIVLCSDEVSNSD